MTVTATAAVAAVSLLYGINAQNNLYSRNHDSCHSQPDTFGCECGACPHFPHHRNGHNAHPLSSIPSSLHGRWRGISWLAHGHRLCYKVQSIVRCLAIGLHLAVVLWWTITLAIALWAKVLGCTEILWALSSGKPAPSGPTWSARAPRLAVGVGIPLSASGWTRTTFLMLTAIGVAVLLDTSISWLIKVHGFHRRCSWRIAARTRILTPAKQTGGVLCTVFVIVSCFNWSCMASSLTARVGSDRGEPVNTSHQFSRVAPNRSKWWLYACYMVANVGF